MTYAYLCRNSACVALSKGCDRPDGLETVEVPCTGRVDVRHILSAVERGATRVLVVACHPGVCRSLVGNRHAERKVERARELLAEIACTASVELHHVAANEPGRLGKILAGDAKAEAQGAVEV